MRDRMPQLYFDIAGTLLGEETGLPKPLLANGGFEAAVIKANFTELVCVGNFVAVLRTVREVNPDHDTLGALFNLCSGVFKNQDWFESVVSLVGDPIARALEVDLDQDWWYVDDLAEHYFQRAGRSHIYEEHAGGRIGIPTPHGDGADILKWLHEIP